jgi:hypothetical protein
MTENHQEELTTKMEFCSIWSKMTAQNRLRQGLFAQMTGREIVTSTKQLVQGL